MQRIKPKVIIYPEREETAVWFDVFMSHDDLETQAIFRCSLYTEEKTLIYSKEIHMNGEDYQNWDNSNAEALNFVLNYFGLEIDTEYVEPIVEE